MPQIFQRNKLSKLFLEWSFKGKSVKEILMGKHPDLSILDSKAFISCNKLPTLIDVDVCSQVKKVAQSLSGVAKPFAGAW